MNIVRVYGGLGNQLFQYALGRVMKQNGIDVYYDVRGEREGENNTKLKRYFRLSKFEVEIKEQYGVHGALKRERDKVYQPKMLRVDGLYLWGYWQFYKYFDHISHILKREIVLKEQFHTKEFLKLRNLVESTDSVSMHIRRGDYLTSNKKANYRELPFKYYFDAVKYTEGDLYIFSDDIPWCQDKFKENYFGRKITFVNQEDYLDFEVMKHCKQNIITNSTFSWWAAYLNNNPEKKVVCPKHWLGGYENNERYPFDWIRIEDYV